MTDLVGRAFGELTVLEYVGNYKWMCKCSCGNTKQIRGSDLTSGRTKSCGCLKKRLIRQQKLIDLTNMVFGRLTVVGISSQEYNDVTWKCVCECGNTVSVKGEYLRNGDTKSCGCLKSDLVKLRNYKHGKAKKTRLYTVWKGMRERCSNSNSKAYAHYGARGVTVCDEWNDFESFYSWAISNGYNEDLPTSLCTIDRIDNNLGYSPDNCRWVCVKEQARNRTNNHIISFNGQSKTIAEWSEITGIPERVISSRINRYGWSVERALTVTIGKKNGS